MHQTRKGQQWYFGMKLHVGADSKSKLILSTTTTTAADVHDANATLLGELLHGAERRVYGDQALQGSRAVIREHARTPRTLPTAAGAIAALSMRCSGARTTPSPGFAPRSSTASA
jgi:IS5 family transposase